MIPVLRDYQDRAVDAVRAEYAAGKRRVVLVSPTGSGKTVCFAYVAAGAAAKGKRVLIMAHRMELIEQISETLSRFQVEHGLILAGRGMDRQPVQVGMLGTVARRLTKIAAPDLLVIDEAHRAVGRTYMSILEAFPAARALLVTATPARTDGRGLGEAADALVLGPAPKELIAAGHLSPYRLFCPPVVADLSSVRTVAGDYDAGMAASAMDKPTITGDAIAHYRAHADGLQFCVFCCGLAHAANVASRFAASGIPTANIDGTMSRAERADIVGRLRSGALRGVTSVNLLLEGFDLPSLSCAVWLRPTQSLIVWVQGNGRAFRPAENKTAIILDHVGNALRLGPPDQDREWTLYGREKRKRGAAERGIAVRQCKTCFCVYPAHLTACPHCGNAADAGSRRIEERDGELVEVTPQDEFRELLANVSYAAALRACETPEQIREMAKARGYRPQWAVMRVMERHGVGKFQAAQMLGYHPGVAAHMRDRRPAA